MPRRRKLPPGYPTQPYIPRRVPKHDCEHCGGTTKPIKGQTLEQAIANHLVSCPRHFQINPKRKKD